LAIQLLKKDFHVVTYHDRPTKEQLFERISDADAIIPIREGQNSLMKLYKI
jgi:hypothetical protein